MESQRGRKRTRERKTQEKKTKRFYGRYFSCIAGLILLVLASFLAPRAVFAIQDDYQEGRVELGARDVLELAQFDLEYEGELSVRLENFAAQLAQGKEFYAVATDFEQDEKTLEEVYDAVTENDFWIQTSYELTGGAISWGFVGDSELVSCKKYVIFDGDLDAGIALSCLYVELHSEYYGDVSVLYDSEDHMIYYYEAEVNAERIDVFDYLRYKVSYEKVYDDQEFPYWMAYNYGIYYQSSEGEIQEDESEIYGYDNVSISTDAYIYGPEINFSRLIKSNHVSYSVELSFQEESLHVMMEMQHDAEEFDTVNAVVGIREIGDLIPEFNRD